MQGHFMAATVYSAAQSTVMPVYDLCVTHVYIFTTVSYFNSKIGTYLNRASEKK